MSIRTADAAATLTCEGALTVKPGADADDASRDGSPGWLRSQARSESSTSALPRGYRRTATMEVLPQRGASRGRPRGAAGARTSHVTLAGRAQRLAREGGT